MFDYEDIKELSMNVINKINEYDIPCHILTKGILPRELLETSKLNLYGITLVSLDEDFRNRFEPGSSFYEDRINALRLLHDNGFKTQVSIEPCPTPNIIDQNLLELLDSINFVDKMLFGRPHYNKLVSEYKPFDFV